MDKEPDFFLSAAGENDELASSRACWVEARLKDQVRDDHMLVEISPPLIGQRYGQGSKDITHLLLTGRHQGFSLFPIKQWPCHVYISRILDDAIFKSQMFTAEQVEIIAWGTIFRAFHEGNVHT
jgi:hypothetical protein